MKMESGKKNGSIISSETSVSNGDLPPLIKAAKEGDADTIELMVKSGEVLDVNAQDGQGRTALHWAMVPPCICATCIENAESCLFMLLKIPGIQLSVADREGLTPLHLAAENQLELCTKKLIFYGANIYAYSNKGDQAIKVVAKKTPNIMVYVLNHCLKLEEGDPSSEKCRMRVDFRPIVGVENDQQLSYQKNWLFSTPCEKEEPNELALLRSLLGTSKYVKNKIFLHPTVAIFLERKWKRVRRQFLMNFIGYLFWLLVYSGYITMVYLINCPCPYYTVKGKAESLEEDTLSSTTPDSFDTSSTVSPRMITCYHSTAPGLDFYLLMFLTTIMAINEIVKIIVTPKLYFKSLLNILNWVLIVMCVVTMLPTFLRKDVIEPELYQLAAITIFLGWALILSQIGKFPTVGQYMEIFGHVLTHFWMFLVTYLALFIAFALAFCILFPGKATYTIFPFSLLKVFVMMIGEMEYQQMFYNDQNDEVSGPLVGHVLYATFVIVVAIVLMNLLVGLTVSDIKGLQKEAELSRVCRQILDMFHMESFWYSHKLPSFFRQFCQQANSISADCEETQKMIARTGSERAHGNGAAAAMALVDHKYSFTFLPNDARDRGVSEKNKIGALEAAQKWKAEITARCQKKCSFGKYDITPGTQGKEYTVSVGQRTNEYGEKLEDNNLPKFNTKF